jgi:4-hydroxybenzoate polyprenyltransferase
MNDSSIPLCLAFDGTLTTARSLDERWLLAIRRSGSHFDATTLPLRRELVEWLRRERAAGRRVVLLADRDRDSAEQVASSLNLFDEVASTDESCGSTAERRRSTLIARYGERGFDYVGSESADRIVWNASRRAIIVGNAQLAHGIDAGTEIVTPLTGSGSKASLRTWIKALRLHQWIKNGLIFVPALLAHVITIPQVLARGLMGFVAFGLCASSVYVINDLFDLTADRQHPRKRHRPFAAGQLSIRSGFTVAAIMLIVSAALAAAVSPRFLAVLAGYYVTTWAYSWRLKRVPLLDVMILAGLYTLRIIAGAAAMDIPLSFWLLAFSVFMFLSLGFVKRYAELHDASRAGRLLGHARGYGESDLPLIMSLGTAAGYSSIVVMALYINSSDSESLYHHHKPLWLICPLMLFWISRVWVVATRGAMHDDPVVFALRDRFSLLTLAALVAIVLLSI